MHLIWLQVAGSCHQELSIPTNTCIPPPHTHPLTNACMHICLQVVGSSHQELPKPNNATYIGSGKVAEILQAVKAFRVDTVGVMMAGLHSGLHSWL
jgi:hypothetical protein